jgi:hypothetical protein
MFVLVPPTDYASRMPNLGDCGLQKGMAELLEVCHPGDWEGDDWNSFPSMTWRRLSACGVSARATLNAWHESYIRLAAHAPAWESAMSRLLFGPALGWLPLWPLLDRMALNRIGLDGRSALAPRLFPGLAARRFASRMANARSVVMNAGGLLADHLVRYLPGRLFALYAAQRAGLPTAVVNYTFAVERPDLLALAAPIMRSATLHVVRESISRERLIKLGIDERRIRVAPDSAFATGRPAIPPLSKNRPLISLQIRGDRPQNLIAWAELVSGLQNRFSAKVTFLAGCRKNDPPVLDRLRRSVPIDDSPYPSTLEGIKQAIGGSHALITDRYHGIVFAAQTGTPFVALASTTHKSEGLARDLNYPLGIHPRLSRRNVPAVVEDAARCLADRAALGGRLSRSAESCRELLFVKYRAAFQRLAAAKPQRRTNG